MRYLRHWESRLCYWEENIVQNHHRIENWTVHCTGSPTARLQSIRLRFRLKKAADLSVATAGCATSRDVPFAARRKNTSSSKQLAQRHNGSTEHCNVSRVTRSCLPNRLKNIKNVFDRFLYYLLRAIEGHSACSASASCPIAIRLQFRPTHAGAGDHLSLQTDLLRPIRCGIRSIVITPLHGFASSTSILTSSTINMSPKRFWPVPGIIATHI